MTALDRRALLGATALAMPAVLLAGCTCGGSVPTVAANVVTDVDTIVAALQASLPALQQVVGAGAAHAALIVAHVQSAVAAAAQLASTVSESVGQSVVTQIGADFSAILAALSGYTLPGTVQTVLNAIQVLLPVVTTAVGLVAAAGAAGSGMTPAQARLVLLAAAPDR